MGARGQSDFDRWSERCKQIAQDFEKAKAMTTLPPEIAEIDDRNADRQQALIDPVLSATAHFDHNAVVTDCATLLNFIKSSLRPVEREKIASIIYATIFGGTSDPTLDENAQGIANSCADAIIAAQAAPTQGDVR